MAAICSDLKAASAYEQLTKAVRKYSHCSNCSSKKDEERKIKLKKIVTELVCMQEATQRQALLHAHTRSSVLLNLRYIVLIPREIRLCFLLVTQCVKAVEQFRSLMI